VAQRNEEQTENPERESITVFGDKYMAEEKTEQKAAPHNPDEIALELMKFIAMTTGYGKGTPTAGFAGKGPRTSEEHADALLELFDRCRRAARKDPS
jgi:hypothetical protein